MRDKYGRSDPLQGAGCVVTLMTWVMALITLLAVML